MNRTIVPLMLASLALTLALIAAVAQALVLPFKSSRQIQPQDFATVFTLAANNAMGTCPQQVEFTTVATLNAQIPPSEIELNAQSCTGDAYLEILDQGTANSRLEGDSKQLTSEISAAVTNENAIFGIFVGPLTCGQPANSQLTSGTLVVVFKSTEPDVMLRGNVIDPNLLHMYLHPGNRDDVCRYTGSMPTETPTMDPSMSPMVSPSSSPPAQSTGPSETVPPVLPGDEEGMESPDTSGSPGIEGGVDADSSEEPSQSPDNEDAVCFPADATVQLENGAIKKMAQVAIGDRVKVSNGLYSDVFLFTHKVSTKVYSFVTLSTQSGFKLSVTSGHFIYINDRLNAAKTATIGDTLTLADGSTDRIVKIDNEFKTGLYNPQTLHGDILVNGIRASTFTTTVASTAAQAMLTPLRALYSYFGMSLSILDNGADKVITYLPRGVL